LVNYHTEYMLFRNNAIERPLNASRYLDHRSAGDEGDDRDARIGKNLKDIIGNLEATNEVDQESYKRVMHRGRPAEEAAPNADGNADGANGGNGGFGGNGGGNYANAGYNPIDGGNRPDGQNLL